ncbi:MAG TPA: EamA family transporter [candidate division Zixibacteria bacterium]|nr:EamA family transporter [candidate division Zixibacteria bacterium]MDD4918884.1 EamA family transporter [candidate division Zixibacteria bacterium]MDM7973872.1 EamA family transporter [candidate division Zixibacteria bacterium]HOZ08984.1 EamA family transporter [candidate division Zixibacteria bacterium]HPM36008.1 EamA family transporter [candidate division Zixibacteria bacterium]
MGLTTDPAAAAPAGASEDHRGFASLAFALFTHQVLGALTFPAARFGLATIEPFTFAFYRFVLSAVVLLAIVRFRRWRVPIERRDFKKIAGLGCLVVLFNQVTYLVGQSLTTASHGALLFATTPIWIFILAMIHLREPFRWRRAVGVAIAVTGVIIIMSAGGIHLGLNYVAGDAIILFAVVVWAYYTVWGKPLVRRYGAVRVTAYALASGSLLYFPFGLYRAVTFDYGGVVVAAWLSVGYVAIGTSVVAYILWYWLLKHMEASRLAVYHNIQPIVASLVACVFLNEPLGWPFVIGGAVVLGGVILTEV